jgi:hypothetical protein
VIEDLLRAALADARVPEHTAVLLLVPGYRERATEYAYLPPGGGPYASFEHRVLYDAESRLEEFADWHRFVAYAEAGLPTSALGVGLRHESEHAVQFNQHGHPLAALESILRRGMRRAGRGGDYVRMPAEIEANRAANEFARQNYLEDIEALEADERTRQFVQPLDPVADLVGETVAMIWNYVEPDDVDDQDEKGRSFAGVVAELEDEARAWVPIDPQYWVARPDGLVVRLSD